MAAVMQQSLPSHDAIKVLAGSAADAPWIDCGPGVQIKVLAVDPAHHCVQYLARAGAHHNAGLHRHLADASVFVLEGLVKNLTTGCEFGPGDFCFQPAGDVHEECTGPAGAVTYISQRGDGDMLVEFLDADGAVCAHYSVSDFAALL